MIIREKQHRLRERNYQGEVSVSFTLCITDRVQLFKSIYAVTVFINILKSQVEESSCIIPVYYFMPDHQHLIVTGTDSNSGVLDFIKAYKQKTGYWLSQNLSSASWQKDFFDHIIRKDEGLVNIARYILDNPVRKGLVANWQKYPFKGAMSCELDYILQAMV
ncbi:MAG: REP-associated tyrosine transposase [Desulfobaccales bacterium]